MKRSRYSIYGKVIKFLDYIKGFRFNIQHIYFLIVNFTHAGSKYPTKVLFTQCSVSPEQYLLNVQFLRNFVYSIFNISQVLFTQFVLAKEYQCSLHVQFLRSSVYSMFNISQVLFTQCLVSPKYCLLNVQYLQSIVYSMFSISEVLFTRCLVSLKYCFLNAQYLRSSVYSMFHIPGVVFTQCLVSQQYCFHNIQYHRSIGNLMLILNSQSFKNTDEEVASRSIQF